MFRSSHKTSAPEISGLSRAKKKVKWTIVAWNASHDGDAIRIDLNTLDWRFKFSQAFCYADLNVAF